MSTHHNHNHHDHDHSHHDHAHDEHHGHDHGHGGHHHEVSNINTAFKIAISLNLIFTVIEMIAAWMANSTSLFADAGHNLGDVLSLAMSWGALWLLGKKASDKYSYGFKRTTILAALINAFILVAASMIIGMTAIDKFIHLSTYVNEKIIILVALIGIVVNGVSALFFMKGQHDLNIKSAFLHLMYDALISAGVVVSGILIYFTHAWWIDPVVGLLIVITILYGSWGLLRQSLDLILDAVPRAINLNNVRDYLLSHENITAVHDLHIWGLSTKETALTAHLIVPTNDMDHVQLDKINAELKKLFNIHHTTLQVEVNEQGCERETECC